MFADETESGPNFGFVTAPSARFWVVMQLTQLGPFPPVEVVVAVVAGPIGCCCIGTRI